jgi:hypothetical protein
VVWVFWKYSDENLPTGKNVKVAVAGYVTTQSRFKVYVYMTEFDEYVLYCDTDLLIYIQKVGETQKANTGDYVGDLTVELESLAKAPDLKNLSRVAPKPRILCLFPVDGKTHDETK